MKKIIVFGATGNTGAYFVDYCNSHIDKTKYEVIASGIDDTDFFTNQGIKYIRLDITKQEEFNKLPFEDVHAIVNLAGVLPAYLSSYNPFVYINVNITGAVGILEYAKKVGADRVLYAQTWAEMAGYWGKEEVLSPRMERKLIYKGDHAFYAITKSMVVETMKHYHQEYGIKDFIFRLPNIYLYSPQKFNYIDGIKKPIAYRYMIDRISEGQDIEMWGNPDAFKDMVYVKDYCQMLFKALFAEVDGGTYNVGTGVKTTLREQINGMIKVFAPKGTDIKIIEKPEKSTFTSFVMDISDAEHDLGYKPEYNYIAYLEDYKKEMQANRFAPLFNK